MHLSKDTDGYRRLPSTVPCRGLHINPRTQQFSNAAGAGVIGVFSRGKMFKAMLERSSHGSVVNISSAAGVRSTGTGSVYAMTKAVACSGMKCSQLQMETHWDGFDGFCMFWPILPCQI